MELDMPTPCTECGEIFDLHDGRRNPRGGNNVICSECADRADEESERAEEIMALWSEIEEAKFTIKAAKGRLRELGINPEAPNER